MELEEIFDKIDVNVLIFILTSLFAFLAWLVKGLIEKPLSESKETFNRFLGRRVEILTEIKVRLNFIAYFPGEESKEFKKQLQELLLRDGQVGYLNKETLEAVLKISIDPQTNETLLLKTLAEIDTDLLEQISKIQDEVSFYRKFSNYNPFRKFVGFVLLAIQYVLSFALIISFFYLIVWGIVYLMWLLKLVLLILVSILLTVIYKWLNKA